MDASRKVALVLALNGYSVYTNKNGFPKLNASAFCSPQYGFEFLY